MFWSLLTALVAGFAGAGVGLALRALSGRRLPRGATPICAGLAMIAATVATEYGWYGNVLRTMAPDTVVVDVRRQRAWYQPWTHVAPWVRGFIGFSPSDTVETAAGSGILVVQLRRQERWQPQMILPNLVDCGRNRRAELRADTDFDAGGAPVNAPWIAVDGTDPILRSVCGGGVPGE